MSVKLLKSTSLGLVLASSMLISNTALACDNKGCESAYLAETQQHIANQIRRANTHKVERHAYSKNRERRAYASYVHNHMMWSRLKTILAL